MAPRRRRRATSPAGRIVNLKTAAARLGEPWPTGATARICRCSCAASSTTVLCGTRPVNVRDVARSVLQTLAWQVDPGQLRKVTDSLPHEVLAFRRDQMAKVGEA